MQLRFVLKNKDLKSKVRRIDLKWILLNQLKWILDELFIILHGQYQPMQLCLRSGFSSPTWASFPLIGTEDSAGAGYHLLVMPRSDVTLWMTFCVSMPILGVICTKFPRLSPIAQIHKTTINWPYDGLYIWAGLPLMWNVKFNTKNDFMWIGAHELGYLCPISLTCPNILYSNRYKSTHR